MSMRFYVSLAGNGIDSAAAMSYDMCSLCEGNIAEVNRNSGQDDQSSSGNLN